MTPDVDRGRPTAVELRPVLVRLFSLRVQELAAPERELLLQLEQVRATIAGFGDPGRPETQERAVRALIAHHVLGDGVFTEPERRFLAVCFDADGTRARDWPGGGWQTELLAAYSALQGREITSVQAVRGALARRTGTVARLTAELADAIVAAEQGRGAQRVWVHGPPVSLPPDAAYGRFVLVTSHHGTGQSAGMAKFRERCAPDAELIDFDLQLAEAGRDYLHRLAPDSWHLPVRGRELSVIYELSRRAIYTIWREALERVWPDVVESLRARRVVLFCCSATVYQHGTGSVSTVLHEAAFIEALRRTHGEPAHVRKALRDALVVTLVDDIYDCFVRLQRTGHPLEPSGAWFRYFSTRSAALGAIIDWRQREIDAAEGLAKLLAWRHVILATKHPLATLAKIIDGVPIVYLSHPTSSARSSVAGQPSDEQQTIIAIADGLAAKPDLALIEPLAIDELRFRDPRPRSDRPREVDAELLPRWRGIDQLVARAGELLWVPPEPDELPLLDQPFEPRPASIADAGTGQDIDQTPLWSAETDQSLLLLRNEVDRATGFRQRLLVNQANGGLFVHRPFAGVDGQVRKSAVEEIMLRTELRGHEAMPLREPWHPDEGRPLRPIVYYHPSHDDERRAVENVVAALSQYRLHSVRSDAAPEAIKAAIEPWARRCLATRTSDGTARVGLAEIESFARVIAELADSRLVLEPSPLGLGEATRIEDLDGHAQANYRAFAAELAALLDGRAGDTYAYGMVLFDDAVPIAAGGDGSGGSTAEALVERYHQTWRRVISAQLRAEPPTEQDG